MTNTNKNLKMLKKLTAEFRAASEEKAKLKESIEGFSHNFDITMDLVKELSKMQIMELEPGKAEFLGKVLLGIHFPEVSNIWRDDRDDRDDPYS